MVKVGNGGHDGLELDDVVTEQGFNSTSLVANETFGYAFGYPAQKKWKGNDLIYCSGPIDRDPHNDDATYRLNQCKLNGGSSVGSWMIDFDEQFGFGTVVSVNSYGYTGINAMHGPYLNLDTQAVYDKAVAGGEIAP